MLGAIIGDTVGSIYEFNNIKTTDFPLFVKESSFTDDSIMTFAVLDWLLRDESHSSKELENSLVAFAQKYPNPNGGYGSNFHNWLFSPEYLPSEKRDAGITSIKSILNSTLFTDSKVPKRHPYNSWGNGSAMRVSAIGWMFDTLEETERVAKISAEISHNHPEGIKGAQVTAAAIFLARTGNSKERISSYIETKYGYDLSKTCDDIRPSYIFDESCQGTVPPALIAFLDSTDFESAIRLAVSLGGDSDTLACITGGIAEAFYKKVPEEIKAEMMKRLPADFIGLLKQLKQKSSYVFEF